MFSISLLIIAAAIVYMVEAYIHTYYAVEYMHGTSLFFVLLAQYGVPVLFLLLCAHIIYKQTEKKKEKEQSETDTQAESKEEKYLTQINAVVGTKTIFSEQADQMRYQVRRFGQKMATAYSMTQDSKTSGEQAKCLILLASAEKIFMTVWMMRFVLRPCSTKASTKHFAKAQFRSEIRKQPKKEGNL